MIINLTKKLRLLTKGKVCREDIDVLPVLQTKTVTESGTVVPDTGYVGLSQVNVSVPEASLSILDNLANPAFPKFGRVKYITNENNLTQVVRYNDIIPSALPVAGSGVETKTTVYTSQYVADAHLRDLFKNTNTNPIASTKRITVGDAVYDAYLYCSGIVSHWFKYQYNYAVILPYIKIPPCVCRIAVCDSNSTQIEIQEYNIDNFIDTVSQSATSQMVSVAAGSLMVSAPSLPFILGAEFVYEKHNIKFSGSVASLKYSEDDGASFSQVTSGTEIRNAEHVVLKNEGSTALNIGTESGGSDITPIVAGGTVVVPLAANGTWYVTSAS